MTAFPKPEKKVRAPKPLKRCTTRIKVKRPLGTVRKEAKAEGDLTTEQWARICEFYQRDGFTYCAYECGRLATEQEHIVPLGKSRNPGKHTAANVCPSCSKCNSEKGLQTWEPRRRHPFMEPRS
jgi:5-methylcytosine-specific restriction endonuclease McrA